MHGDIADAHEQVLAERDDLVDALAAQIGGREARHPHVAAQHRLPRERSMQSRRRAVNRVALGHRSSLRP